MPTFEGRPIGRQRRIGIVCSRFNGEVTSKLLDGALAALEAAGVDRDRITIAYVPGAFELPLAIRRLARSREFDAMIAIGAVIRGETDHYDHVCRAAQEGISQLGMREDLPVMFGVLTCDTEEQAMDRAGGKHGNKGTDAALAALSMADLFDQFGGVGR